jgi:FkbM family methyltransferase
VKLWLARQLCRSVVGRLIGWLHGDRIPTAGLVVSTAGGHIAPSIKARIFWGLYESAEVRYVRRYLRTDLDVVELGSSIGVVSAHIAKTIQPGFRLICVEANASLLPYLECNLATNVPEVPAIVHHAAVSYERPPNSQGTLVLGNDHLMAKLSETRRGGGSGISVPFTTLRELLKTYSVQEYALVCDIEGAEAGLLRDDGQALSTCQQIIIELHDTFIDGVPVSISDMRGMLERQGFQQHAAYGGVHVYGRA